MLTGSTVTLVLGLRVGGIAPPTYCFFLTFERECIRASDGVFTFVFSLPALTAWGCCVCILCIVPLARRLVPPLVLLFCVLDEAAALALSVGGVTPLRDGSVSSLWSFRVCTA